MAREERERRRGVSGAGKRWGSGGVVGREGKVKIIIIIIIIIIMITIPRVEANYNIHNLS